MQPSKYPGNVINIRVNKECLEGENPKFFTKKKINTKSQKGKANMNLSIDWDSNHMAFLQKLRVCGCGITMTFLNSV